MTLFRRFLKDEDGATAIEYALIAALMATIIIAGIGALGEGLQGGFDRIAGCVTDGVC